MDLLNHDTYLPPSLLQVPSDSNLGEDIIMRPFIYDYGFSEGNVKDGINYPYQDLSQLSPAMPSSVNLSYNYMTNFHACGSQYDDRLLATNHNPERPGRQGSLSYDSYPVPLRGTPTQDLQQMLVSVPDQRPPARQPEIPNYPSLDSGPYLTTDEFPGGLHSQGFELNSSDANSCNHISPSPSAHHSHSTSETESISCSQELNPCVESSGQPYICNLCDVTTGNEKFYRRHMKQHSRPHKCEVCAKAFKTRRDLRRHQLTHDTVSAEGIQVRVGNFSFCPHTDCASYTRGFSRKDNFLRHMRTQHQENGNNMAARNLQVPRRRQ